MEIKENKNIIEFKYECSPSNIDINTLLVSQLHFVSIITEIQKSIYPDYELKIKVEAPKDGSFIFQQIYELAHNSHLFSRENMAYAADTTEVLMGIFGGYFGLTKIVKHLKGKKAKEIKENKDGTGVTIINKEGVEIKIDKSIFILFQSNPTININVNQYYQTLEQDENINGVNISSKTHKELNNSVARDDFEYFTMPNEYLEVDTLEKPKQGQRVFIKKPDLIPKKNKVTWSVIYDGREIKVSILDVGFIEAINKGLRVAQGDSMLVDMNIIAVFDKTYNTHIDKTFQIIKVREYIERKHFTQGSIE